MDSPEQVTRTPDQQQSDPMQLRRGVIRWAIRETIGVAMVGVILFVSAGTLSWTFGWVLVALYAGWTLANAVLLIPRSPELLVERATRHKDIKSWDTQIMGIVGLLTIAKQVVAGLDFRFDWTQGLGTSAQVMATLVAAAGYGLVTWSMVANAYFSTLNRIQEDRGHAVASGGPYRLVRHPGYVGTVLFELATPVLLGSWWAMIPGVVSAVLMVIRTGLEDRTLQQELPGYADFATKTRHRLLPGVW